MPIVPETAKEASVPQTPSGRPLSSACCAGGQAGPCHRLEAPVLCKRIPLAGMPPFGDGCCKDLDFGLADSAAKLDGDFFPLQGLASA